MGEMAQYYREWDASVKHRKEERLSDAQAIEWPCRWQKHTEYHWSTVLNVHRLDYWPSTGKWIWCAKKFHGDAQSLARFIKKRTADKAKEKDNG
ncbi:hypothetical protein MXMO3_01673 [Maritalea myrionectae]|uniref:Uncharacterized protein n=1 Tax=Maritalea myrionectae TaxID=454601 RepID=A0A2R4MEA4_9HYPH|nr:hypothetical protein [Maritalea myrionectae]AVX04199.1 hypothetical protein MXMO3_01673 [Maritalea myrionectae]